MNIVNNKKQKSKLFWVLPVLAAAFFALPLIFPDQESNNASNFEEEQEGSLPVIASDNPLSKYFSKLADFYGMGKKSFSKKNPSLAQYAEEIVQERSSGAEDNLIFSFDNEGNANGIMPDANGAMPAFMFVEGNDVIPAGNGYYYNGAFYENGAYPDGVNGKKIENALLKYYKAVAAKNGKVAAYQRQPDGSLSVAFFTPEKMNQMQSGGESDGEHFSAYLADASKYRGARIDSRYSSAEGGRGASSSAGNGSAGPMGDFGDRYDSINEKISNLVNESALSYSTPSKEESGESEGEGGGKDVDLDGMRGFNNRRYPEGNPKDAADYDKRAAAGDFIAEYNNTPIVINSFSSRRGDVSPLAGILRSLGLGAADDEDVNTPLSPSTGIKDTKAVVGDSGYFRYFSVLSGEDRLKELTEIEGEFGKTAANPKAVFYEAFRAPFFNYSAQNSEKPDTFKKIFYERTGLKTIAVAGNFCKDKRANLENSYDEADAVVKALRKELTQQLMAKKEIFRDVRPQVVFPLGIDTKTGNITIATAESPLYSYAPQAIPEVARKAAEQGKTYVGISPSEFKHYFANKAGVAAVTNSPENRKVLQKSGIGTVVDVEDRQLSSYAPADIMKNAQTVGMAMGSEFRRIMDDNERKELDDAFKKAEIEKKVKEAKDSVDGKKPKDTHKHGTDKPKGTTPKQNVNKNMPPSKNGQNNSWYYQPYQQNTKSLNPNNVFGPFPNPNAQPKPKPAPKQPQKQADQGIIESAWNSIKSFFGG